MEKSDMERLASVIMVLRHENRNDLASLLSRATIDFEEYDEGYDMLTGNEIALETAVIYAPISDCMKLRELSPEDNQMVLDAVCEIWPSQGGVFSKAVFKIDYRIDPEAFDHHHRGLFPHETGWPRVDRTWNEIEKQLATAATEEQFQQVGLLCRDALISLAQAVFDPGRHPKLDINEPDPSSSDAKRMLERYVGSGASGRSNAMLRKYARIAVDFANDRQHARNGTFRQAALCAEATRSVINFIAILEGRRDSDYLS